MVKGRGDQTGSERLFYEEREDIVNIAGFVDLHIHGAGRYDTKTDEPGHILKIAELHGREGTRAILPTIYPGSLLEMKKNMGAVKMAMELQRAEGRKSKGSSLHATAFILGVHLEGPFLNPARCGALDGRSFLKPSLPSFQKIIEGHEDIVRIITVAPEMPGALRLIEKCAASGIRVNMGHSEATYEEAVEGKKAGATGITHIFNAMKPFHHREPGLAGLGLIDEDLYIEVIADGVHLHPKTLELVFNRKRLDRIILVSDAVKGAKKKGMPIYDTAGLLAGSGGTLSDAVEELRYLSIPDAEIIEAAIDNPSRYIRHFSLPL